MDLLICFGLAILAIGCLCGIPIAKWNPEELLLWLRWRAEVAASAERQWETERHSLMEAAQVHRSDEEALERSRGNGGDWYPNGVRVLFVDGEASQVKLVLRWKDNAEGLTAPIHWAD